MSKPIPWYDDYDKIFKKIKKLGLEGLNEVVQARTTIMREKDNSFIPHNRFVIAGSILLGPEDEVNRFKGKIPKDKFPCIPLVLATRSEEFETYCDPVVTSWESVSVIPNGVVKCPHCGHGWNLDNCSDFKWIYSEHRDVPSPELIGTKYSDVLKVFTHPKADHILSPHPNYPVHNTEYEESRDGWIPDENYIITNKDILYFCKFTLFHRKCYGQHQIKNGAERLEKLLKKGGVKNPIIEFIQKNSHNVYGWITIWHVHFKQGSLEIVIAGGDMFIIKCKYFIKSLPDDEGIASNVNSRISSDSFVKTIRSIHKLI